MSTKPSAEAQRLEIVRAAARHLLAQDARGRTDIGTWEIYPPDVGRPESGTSEYTWRGQLAWCWWKAGFLDEKVVGQGMQRRRIYAVLPSGREALGRIAEDPVLASFYIKRKRSGVGVDYPSEWYRPPQLDVGTEAAIEDTGMESDPDREEGEGEAGREGAGGEEAPNVLEIYLERTTAVLETLVARSAVLESEVRGHSDILLEIAQKLSSLPDSPSVLVTKDDLGKAAAEMASAIVRRESAAASLAGAITATETAVKSTTARVESLATELMKTRSEIASTRAEMTSASLAVSAKLEGMEGKLFDAGDFGDQIKAARSKLGEIGADIESLAETSEALMDKFDDNIERFRDIVGAAVQVAGSAQEILAAGQTVAREMIAMAAMRTKDVPASAVFARAEETIRTLEEQKNRVGGSVSALGGGLIRPSSETPK
jgi:hypothetical protein